MHLALAMFYFLALNSGSVFAGYKYRFCVSRLIPVMLAGVCMAHRITCLIPTCKNRSICGRNNTKTTFLEIFFIPYHFITSRKVSSAISRSSLNTCEKTFEKSRYTKPIPVTGYTHISLPEITRPEFHARFFVCFVWLVS